jgi:predicted dehydrogenase
MATSRLTRRRFLGTSGGAALGAVALPAFVPARSLGRDGTPAPSQRVTIGGLGCGNRGSIMWAMGGAEVVAVCDPWKDRRERFAARSPAAKPYADFREVLARDDVDAIVAATPDHWHVPIAVAASKAGKDMYIEKPLALTVAEGQACRKAVRQYRRVFQYGTMHRSNPRNRFACELVRNGRIGEVREIHVRAHTRWKPGSWAPQPVPADLDYDLWLGQAPWTPYTGCPKDRNLWLSTYDYTIGFLGGWGAHPMDLVVWAYDTHKAGPWEVEGTGVIHSGSRTDAVAEWTVRYRFGSGAQLTFVSGGGGMDIRFVGTEGSVRFGGALETEPASLATSKIGPNDIHLQASKGGHGGDFLDAIRNRRDPVSNVEDAVRSDIISHLGDIAVRTGRKIVWDPAKEQIVGDEEAARMLRRPMREPWRL